MLRHSSHRRIAHVSVPWNLQKARAVSIRPHLSPTGDSRHSPSKRPNGPLRTHRNCPVRVAASRQELPEHVFLPQVGSGAGCTRGGRRGTRAGSLRAELDVCGAYRHGPIGPAGRNRSVSIVPAPFSPGLGSGTSTRYLASWRHHAASLR